MAMTTNKISVYDKNFSGNILNSSYNSYMLKHHDNAIRIGLNFETIVQTINHKSPLAISIMNKENGDKIKIINTGNTVEIIEILN